jgi:hypothetical protein
MKTGKWTYQAAIRRIKEGGLVIVTGKKPYFGFARPRVYFGWDRPAVFI